jgi:hypothetical protein
MAEQPIYQTNGMDTRKARKQYWIIMSVVTVALPILGIVFGHLLALIGVLAAVWGVMLINGFRAVAGWAIYEDRIRVVTILGETELQRNELRMVRYEFVGRLDIYGDAQRHSIQKAISTVLPLSWPYMVVINRRNRQEVEVLQRYGRR